MWRSLFWSFCGLIVLFGSTWTATSTYYTAGVVEFRLRVSGASSAQLLDEHLEAYLALIRSPEANETDIIVFPEGTLNSVLQLTAVPAPGSFNNSLCNGAQIDEQVAPFLRQLACAAQETSTYLVINVKEREACETGDPCSSNGYNVFNTNVVFDRNGTVISRYRKWNLYLEPMTNQTAAPELATFQTDFGVTFGHIICFDMLFYTPAQDLIEKLDVRDVIVTKMFNSELPFLTASQLQQGWAWGNNVNLLAAGASYPQAGISGSGIYAGQQGALVRRMVGDSDEGVRELLVARVPFWPTPAEAVDVPRPLPAQRRLLLLQQPRLEDFNTQLLEPHNGSSSYRLCQQDLCCEFQLNTTIVANNIESSYHYRLGVFVGQRTYEEARYSVVRLCGLFACHNASLESCGQLHDEVEGEAPSTYLQFSELSIRGEFVQRERRLLMPSTLSSSLYALQASEMDWQLEECKDSAKTLVEMRLLQLQSELLTFGIYGNYFDERSAAKSQNLSVAMLLLSGLMLWSSCSWLGLGF
ncbi:vanin-like protein 3 [Scaptodrosophila lebanonensis]|uniref:Vanin-like protein 3 n=1 Tax=Drosophila lebanonensis TaxID=7225 RepID=A0A6J2TXX9_DROLE|nr:vanin-like protein 3 [Scaptodrosophila lebanonensis]